jgi:AcrR family transcriptional regulator
MTIVNREAYFETALKILAEQGFTALTVPALCEALAITKGSFYHHFHGWDDFVAGLLAHWESEQTYRIFELTRQIEDPQARVEILAWLASNLPHAAEAAIRAWSKSDPHVAEAQQRVDEERIKFTLEVISAVIPDSPRARRLAKLGVALLVGMEELDPHIGARQLRKILDEYLSLVLPRPPAKKGDRP